MRSHFITSTFAIMSILAIALVACKYVQVLAPSPATTVVPEATGDSSIMVYIKVVLEKEYGVVAHVFGGKRNSIWRRTDHDPDNSWWDNPLIVYADPPIRDPDVTGGADARPITGSGSSSNVTVRVTLVPHVDVAVKTDPASDCVSGTITTTISSMAGYYDGGWTELVDERDRTISFAFDTRDPNRGTEELGRETQTIASFALERYTRDQEKWEPRTHWPIDPMSGDWRVVIYGTNAIVQVTRYRYLSD